MDVTLLNSVSTCARTGGFPQMFELRYRRSSEDVSSEVNCEISGTDDLSKVLTGLDPLTVYTVRIRAGNSQGFSDFSPTVTFSTFG